MTHSPKVHYAFMKKIITTLLPFSKTPSETPDLERAEPIRESSTYETYLHKPLGWVTAAVETGNNLIGYSSTPLFFITTLIDTFSSQEESDDNGTVITMYSLIILFALFVDMAVVVAHYMQNNAENKAPSTPTVDRLQSLQPLANMGSSTPLSIQTSSEPLPELTPSTYNWLKKALERAITSGVYVGEIFDFASQPIALAQTIAPNLKERISLLFQTIMLALGGVIALPATASYHIVVKQSLGGSEDEMPHWIGRLENFTVIAKSSTEAISNAMFLTLMGSLLYGNNKPSSLLSFLPITAMGAPFATFFAGSNGYAEKLLLRPGKIYKPRGFEWKNALLIAGTYLQVVLSLSQNAVSLLIRLGVNPLYIPSIFTIAAIAAIRPTVKRAMELDMTGREGPAQFTNTHNYSVDFEKRAASTLGRAKRLRSESIVISTNSDSSFSGEEHSHLPSHLPREFLNRITFWESKKDTTTSPAPNETATLLSRSAPTPHKTGYAGTSLSKSYGTIYTSGSSSDGDDSSLVDGIRSEESAEDSPQFDFDSDYRSPSASAR